MIQRAMLMLEENLKMGAYELKDKAADFINNLPEDDKDEKYNKDDDE